MALGQRSLTWFEGRWSEGNTPLLGAADHATWQGSMVFDGARAYEGVAPDLDRHAARIIGSAEAMGLAPTVAAEEVAAIVRDGIRRFGGDRPLYLRPMMWAREGSPAIVDPLPESTAFAVCIEDLPFRDREEALSLTVSPFRRPTQDSAVTSAKAGCHYANNARIVRDARARGFHNALSLDQEGHVAEISSANVFMVRDGVVLTPAANGTFLAGITRARVIGLLREDGREVVEASLTVGDFAAADEIFLTGNANKVTAVTRFEDRELGHGPVARRAWALYRDFAHAGRRAA